MAQWQNQMIDHSTYVEMATDEGVSPWTCVVGWRKERNLDDELHVLHQGLEMHHVASMVVHALEDKYGGPCLMKQLFCNLLATMATQTTATKTQQQTPQQQKPQQQKPQQQKHSNAQESLETPQLCRS
jgi:hypothetical protein